ncbi:MAG: CDP-alcohol phosphatidyltransferase family protein [Candidatus Sungbacteria bacterium]|nr:CDP-alcohol phosphatidyltransferase family protein [Candidatus Sungbacteria bacterium]
MFSIFLTYILVGFFSAFLLPQLMPVAILQKLIYYAKNFETSHRDRILKPLVLPLIRLGIHPNVITILGFLLVFAVAYGFLVEANPLFLFFAALFAGLSDMFDGVLARASGKVTMLGGILDGSRDFFLFIVLTARFVFANSVPYTLILWFIVGAAAIEVLKAGGIIKNGIFVGFGSSTKKRLGGEGKLSIDRAKFFFYIAGCLGILLGEVWLPGIYAGYVFLTGAIVLVFLSIICHAVLLRMPYEGHPA